MIWTMIWRESMATSSNERLESMVEWLRQDCKICLTEEFVPTNVVSELALLDESIGSVAASKHLQEGLKEIGSNNAWEKAADLFLKGYQISGDPSLAFNYALAKIRIGDYQEAYKALGWVLDKSPAFPQVEYNLAVVAYLKGEQIEAMELLWKDLQQNWASAKKWRILGYLCSRQEWWSEAAYFFLKSLSLSYGSVEAYRRVYVALARSDNLEAASRFQPYLEGKICSDKRQVAQLIDGIQLGPERLSCQEVRKRRNRVIKLSGFDEKRFLQRVRQALLDKKLPREVQEKLGIEPSLRMPSTRLKEVKKAQKPGSILPSIRLAESAQQRQLERLAAQADAYRARLSDLENQARRRLTLTVLTQLRKAYQAVYARSPTEAITHFQVWVRKYRGKAAALAELAKMYRDFGMYDEAIRQYERVITLDPRRGETETYKSLADMFTYGIETEQLALEDAVHRFEHYVNQDQGSSYARLYLAKFYRQQGRPQDAIKQLKKAIRDQPRVQELYSELALAHLDNGDLDAALQVFVKRGRHTARLSEVYHRLYTLLSTLGNRQALVDRFREFVDLHPGDEYAHFYYGRALQKVGRLQEAVREFKESVRINPGFLEGYDYLSSIFQDMGRFDEAISEFEGLTSRHPDIAHLHYLLGMLYERKADTVVSWRETEQLYQKARSKFRDAIEIWASSRACYALGRSYERYYRTNKRGAIAAVRDDFYEIMTTLERAKTAQKPSAIAAVTVSQTLTGALDAAYVAGLDAVSSTLHETKQKALNAYDCLQKAKQELGDVPILQELDAQLDHLAQRLVAVHRYVSLGIKVDFSLQDINQMVEDVLYTHQARCDALGIEVVRDLDWEGVPEFEVDRTSLLEALNNLVVNAIEALEKWEGLRQITISTSYDGEMVIVKVKDTGPGVPQDRDIFDLGVTTKEKGTGYGLAQVKKAVESIHQGRVTFESSLGQGTTFVIRLPYYRPGEVKAGGRS